MPLDLPPPEPTVKFTAEADKDLRDTTVWFAENASEDVAIGVIARILAALDELAVTPMLSRPVEGLERQYRQWLILDKKYRVYFERVSEASIIVLRLHSARGKPLKNKEIRPTANQAGTSEPPSK